MRPLLALLALVVATAACGGTSSSSDGSRNGETPVFDEPLVIDNPHLPFGRRGRWIYQGTKDGGDYRVEVEVTDETRIVGWSDGAESFETETMVVRHRGWVNDELIEEALDYVAQGEDGSVWYFGEDVDNYRDGQLIDHEGTWLAGIDGALPAMLMPAEPTVGQIADIGEVLAPSDEGELRLVVWHPQGDGADYAPDIDPGAFTATVDHPRLPLPAGANWTYEVVTAEGETDRLEIVVTDDRRAVMGVETTIVEVTLLVDGEVEERTESWYAQDGDGAVWLFGELDEGYEEGELVETSTWEAGVDGAWPGIVMPAPPVLDEVYRVGYVPGEMEERGRVVATDASASVPTGDHGEVWVIEFWSDLDPGVIERKHYAPGIGLVLEESDDPDADRVEIVASSLGP